LLNHMIIDYRFKVLMCKAAYYKISLGTDTCGDT